MFDLFSSSVDILRQSAVDLLSNVAYDPHDVKVRNFFDILDRLSKPFEDVDSTYKLQKYVSNLSSNVAPVEHKLGQRWHAVDSQQQQKLTDDKFVYVSVQQTHTALVKMLAGDDRNFATA